MLLGEKLIVTTSEYGRAVIMPSSEGEKAVAVYSAKRGDTELETRVTYTKADRNIYNTQSEANPNRGHEPPVKIKQIDVSIPRTTALAVATAWKEMLCQTRPNVKTDVEKVIVDGLTVEFSLLGQGQALYGETPGERGKNTESLYQIAKLLISYCEAETSKRPSIAKSIERDADQLVANVKAEK